MINLCSYRDSLGIPNKGFHERRFLGIAINDFIATAILAFFTYVIFNYIFSLTINYFIYLLFYLILAVILHRMFCVKTAVNVLIFGD